MKLKHWAVGLLCCLQLAIAEANVPLMPLKDIQAGMQGVGRTVFQGDTIEEFPVEVIGVSGSEGAGRTVLVKLQGPLIERAGGVAQGMSGSPVYIDGRLVGAIAYGRAFNDPHYCFLTPIGEMLKLVDEPKTQPVDWLPKGTSLMATGFSEEGLEVLKGRLGEMGLEVAAGMDSKEESSKPIEPGSAVGATLMTGDLKLGALGTVTWTDEKGKVIAFGHPFMQRGDSSFFMTRSWVLGCIPNLQSGYKVGNIGSVVGSFTQDRAAGIGGSLGKAPENIPLFVTASDTGRGINRAYRMQIIKDEKLLPAIVDAAVTSSVGKAMNRNGGGTARIKYEITGWDSQKELLSIRRENMFYSPAELLKHINAELNDTVSTLMGNKLDKVDIYGINVEAEVSDEVQIAEIKKVETSKKPVKAGDKLSLRVTLKPYRGEEFTEIIQYKLPEKCDSDRLTLSVRGGSSMAWIVNLLRKQKEEGLPSANKKKDKQKTLQDFVKDVNEADCNNEIIVDLGGANAEKAAEAGEGLSSLLKGSPNKQKFPYDFIVDGEVEVNVKIAE